VHLGRRSFITGTAGAGLLLLAGCSTTSTRTTVADWPLEAGDAPATISWWSASIPSDTGGDLRPALVKAFTEAHPNIRVNVVSAPSDSDVNRTTVATQIAAGSETPDVVMGDIAWPGQFAENKLAVPLTSLVPADFWDQYPEGLRTAARVGDDYYMFPVYIDESFLVYRQDLLDKHSLAVPDSWEEMAQTAKKLIDTGDVDYGFVYQGNVYEGMTCNTVEFTADAGGLLVDADVSKSTATNSETRRALEFMHQLVTDGVTPRASLTYIEQSSLDAFTTGRAAFLRNWSYAYDTANSPDTSSVAGAAGLRARPGFDGGPAGNSTIGGWGNYLNPHTLEPAASLAFAKWMAEEDAQQLIVREGGVIPARTASITSPEAVAADRLQYEYAKDITLVPRPTATPYYPKMSQGIYVNANAIVAGQTPVNAGTKRMADRMDLAIAGQAL
jgi:multiple sugar transport system substrate-binding protein